MEICRAFELFEFGLMIFLISIFLIAVIGLVFALIYISYLSYKADKLHFKLSMPSINSLSFPSLLSIGKVFLGILVGLAISLIFSGCFIGIIYAYGYIKSMFC